MWSIVNFCACICQTDNKELHNNLLKTQTPFLLSPFIHPVSCYQVMSVRLFLLYTQSPWECMWMQSCIFSWKHPLPFLSISLSECVLEKWISAGYTVKQTGLQLDRYCGSNRPPQHLGKCEHILTKHPGQGFNRLVTQCLRGEDFGLQLHAQVSFHVGAAILPAFNWLPDLESFIRTGSSLTVKLQQLENLPLKAT